MVLDGWRIKVASLSDYSSMRLEAPNLRYNSVLYSWRIPDLFLSSWNLSQIHCSADTAQCLLACVGLGLTLLRMLLIQRLESVLTQNGQKCVIYSPIEQAVER